MKLVAAKSPGQLAAIWIEARNHTLAAGIELADLMCNVRQGRQETSELPPRPTTIMPG